jgi:hypothetical protein
MVSMELELGIRFVGYGLSCTNCGKIKETTRYVLRDAKTEYVMQDIRLCDKCQDRGFLIKFRPVKIGVIDQMRARRVKISRQFESALAQDMHGRVQPGSGNQDAKADVRVLGEWRLEHKYTDSVKSYSLKVSDLAAVVKHANMVGELPTLVVSFRRIARKFAVLPYEVFLEIVEKIRGKK